MITRKFEMNESGKVKLNREEKISIIITLTEYNFPIEAIKNGLSASDADIAEAMERRKNEI